MRRFDITEPQGASTKIKTAQKANLIFVSAGREGILVIDAVSNDIILKHAATEFINTLEVTSDGNYLVTSLNNKVTIMSFQDRKSLKMVS